jgi:hypothetical protein
LKHILLLGAIIISLSANAQNFGQKLSGGFNVALGIPKGEFNKVEDNLSIALRGHIMYNFDRNIPMHIGLELGYGTMGSTTKYFYDNYFDEYKVTASSNIFSLQFKLRLQQPKNKLINPFAEGLIGWNDFFSTVNVERLTNYYTYSNYNNSYGNSSEAQWALTYGGAAGADIRLQKDGKLSLEVKAAYMIGSKTKYLTNPQITGSGQVFFTENESETNMLMPQVGIKFGL